ncbi:unnamed protein product [Closterium sp. Yama58-4]|nr:unnamed protein product [Closterium sp. Yama58-4]
MRLTRGKCGSRPRPSLLSLPPPQGLPAPLPPRFLLLRAIQPSSPLVSSSSGHSRPPPHSLPPPQGLPAPLPPRFLLLRAFHPSSPLASSSSGPSSPPPSSLPPPKGIPALLPPRFLLLRAFQPSSLFASSSLEHSSPPPPSLPPPQGLPALLPPRFLLLRAFPPSSPLASSSSGHSSPPPPRFLLLRAFLPRLGCRIIRRSPSFGWRAASSAAAPPSAGVPHHQQQPLPHLQQPPPLAGVRRHRRGTFGWLASSPAAAPAPGWRATSSPRHLRLACLLTCSSPRSWLVCDVIVAAPSAGLPPHLQQPPLLAGVRRHRRGTFGWLASSPAAAPAPGWSATSSPRHLRLACLLTCSSPRSWLACDVIAAAPSAGLPPHLQQAPPPLPPPLPPISRLEDSGVVLDYSISWVVNVQV